MWLASAYEWLGEMIGSIPTTISLQKLAGSTSSSLFLVQSPTKKFVMRLLDNLEWLANERDLAAHEAAALQEAQKAGLAAPTLLAYSDQDVGFGFPVVLMSFLEGKVELCPTDFSNWLENMAKELATIHRHRADGFAWHYRTWVNRETVVPPVWTTIPNSWQRAIEQVRDKEPAYHPVWIHRDYHPANLLWKNGKISGIVDWINACCGPAGVDVAHCRTNLAMMFGRASADQFLQSYLRWADSFEYHPYWDLDSLLDMALPEPTFYSPWRTFGLDRIPAKLLEERMDSYLNSVITKVS